MGNDKSIYIIIIYHIIIDFSVTHMLDCIQENRRLIVKMYIEKIAENPAVGVDVTALDVETLGEKMKGKSNADIVQCFRSVIKI